MAATPLSSTARVSVDGRRLDSEVGAMLSRVEVDLDVDLFGECILEFHDPSLKLMSGSLFGAGAAIRVELALGGQLEEVFSGEVVAAQASFRRDEPPFLRLVCYEALHRLALVPMTRALNDVDERQTVRRIAREHGLSGDAPAGGTGHMFQANISDAGFLRRLAQGRGNRLRIEGKKLVVAPPATRREVSVQPGLVKMRVQLNSGAQVAGVEVRGWDPKSKREIVGSAKPADDAGKGTSALAGAATLSIAGHEPTPGDTDAAKAMAAGRLARLEERFAVARGEMIGNPGVVPGNTLDFDRLDPSIDGKYRVEQARHILSKNGYHVQFKAVRIARKKPAKPPAVALAKPPPDDKTLTQLEPLLENPRFSRIGHQHKDTAQLSVDVKNGAGRKVRFTVEMHDGRLGWVPAGIATADVSGNKARATMQLKHPALENTGPRPPGTKLTSPHWQRKVTREGEIAVMQVSAQSLDGCEVKFVLERNAGGSSWDEISTAIAKVIQGKAACEMLVKKLGAAEEKGFLRFRAQLVRELSDKHYRFQADLLPRSETSGQDAARAGEAG